MKMYKPNHAKVVVIIEAFADYLEYYMKQRCENDDVVHIINERFDEFTSWACDDFIITEQERENLLSSYGAELRESIKNELISVFMPA